MIRFNLISGKCIDNVMSQSTFRVNSLNPESVRSMKSQLSFAHVTLPGSNVTMQEDHEVTFACEKDIK